MRERPNAAVSTASRALIGTAEPELVDGKPASAGVNGGATGAPPPAAALETYALRLLADPPAAQIWLDGVRIGTGEVALALPRDGRTHELRITAPCHTPEILLFRDVPPPRVVLLEPLPRVGNQACRVAPAGSGMFEPKPRRGHLAHGG
jgi:hypothetical protein